jgi:DNA-directed RNA polymerase beta subunit
MGYGHNLILAMGSFTGYNQDDGILMNADSFARGMFRSTFYRSYEAFEEDDAMSHTKTRIGNPVNIPGWTSLKPGVDYSKLDERGIVRVGENVDENSVLVAMYLQGEGGEMRDASVTAQVWTRGRVDKISVTVNNMGLAMVKVRVVQERIPELGDKFSNRHGQKGTIGMLLRGHDMPRTSDGITVDMIMNPHAIPSRMTVAQLIEALVGKAAPPLGTVGNGTLFMNDGNPVEAIGAVLRDHLGMQPFGEELMYDGMSGQLIPTQMFIGNVYTMRLKHMPEDKWNARSEGRREQRTHQPTGGRGAQGGLRIGEMERDAILGHGISDFLRESTMKRADGYETIICNGCGTIPIYNEREGLTICPMCDGPVKYIGETANTLEILPPLKRSVATFSKVEIPYAFKLLDQEMNAYLNMGMRVLTEKDVRHFRGPPPGEITADEEERLLSTILPERVLLDTEVPEMIPPAEEVEVKLDDLTALGLTDEEKEEKERKTYEPTVGMRVEGMGVRTRVGLTVGAPVVGTAVGRLVGRTEGLGEGLVVGGEEHGHVRTWMLPRLSRVVPQ